MHGLSFGLDKGGYGSYLINILNSSVGDWGIDTSRLRLRRSSDNDEQEFNPLNTGLDTVGILAWSGSDSVYVTKIFDKSGNGNHATQTVAVEQPRLADAGVFEVDSNDNKAMYLQEVPNVQNLNITDNIGLDISRDITILARVDRETGDGYYISKNLDSAATAQYGLYDSSTDVQLYLNGVSRLSDLTSDDTSKFLCFTREGSGLTAYVNGIEKDTSSFADSLISRPNLQIGCRSNSIDGTAKAIGLTGFISRIIIFNKALTQQQVTYLSNRI